MLNGVFSELDQLAAKHGLEKIKTIGDAYMVAGGIPNPTRNHTEAVLNFARNCSTRSNGGAPGTTSRSGCGWASTPDR